MLPTFAEIVLVPAASAVARAVALIVAVAALPEVQVAEAVSGCVLPSL